MNSLRWTVAGSVYLGKHRGPRRNRDQDRRAFAHCSMLTYRMDRANTRANLQPVFARKFALDRGPFGTYHSDAIFLLVYLKIPLAPSPCPSQPTPHKPQAALFVFINENQTLPGPRQRRVDDRIANVYEILGIRGKLNFPSAKVNREPRIRNNTLRCSNCFALFSFYFEKKK